MRKYVKYSPSFNSCTEIYDYLEKVLGFDYTTLSEKLGYHKSYIWAISKSRKKGSVEFFVTLRDFCEKESKKRYNRKKS